MLQPIGINSIAATPKKIAKYLKLPDADEYTGHCFLRTVTILTAQAKIGKLGFCNIAGWKSIQTAQRYATSTNSMNKDSSTADVANLPSTSSGSISANEDDNLIFVQEGSNTVPLTINGSSKCNDETNTTQREAGDEMIIDESAPPIKREIHETERTNDLEESNGHRLNSHQQTQQHDPIINSHSSRNQVMNFLQDIQLHNPINNSDRSKNQIFNFHNCVVNITYK